MLTDELALAAHYTDTALKKNKDFPEAKYYLNAQNTSLKKVVGYSQKAPKTACKWILTLEYLAEIKKYHTFKCGISPQVW